MNNLNIDKLQIGKFYKCKESFMVFPSRETIASVFNNLDDFLAEPIPGSSALIESAAAHWGKQLKCNVSIIEKGCVFMALEQSGKFCKIISSQGKVGWIFFPNKTWAFNSIETLEK
jgi:hypothetical protein